MNRSTWRRSRSVWRQGRPCVFTIVKLTIIFTTIRRAALLDLILNYIITYFIKLTIFFTVRTYLFRLFLGFGTHLDEGLISEDGSLAVVWNELAIRSTARSNTFALWSAQANIVAETDLFGIASTILIVTKLYFFSNLLWEVIEDCLRSPFCECRRASKACIENDRAAYCDADEVCERLRGSDCALRDELYAKKGFEQMKIRHFWLSHDSWEGTKVSNFWKLGISDLTKIERRINDRFHLTHTDRYMTTRKPKPVDSELWCCSRDFLPVI